MSGLFWLVSVLCGLTPPDGVLELRLEGPLSAVYLEGVRVPTHVIADLAPAETVTVRVPWLPVDPQAEPRLGQVDGEGSARVLEEEHSAPERAPADVTGRPLPRPVRKPRRVATVAWWLFASGLLAVFAARRRPMGAALMGAVFGLALTALPPRSPEKPVAAVLEVGPKGAWWVYVGLGELDPPQGAHPELEAQPAGASWEWIVDVSDPAHPNEFARAAAQTTLVARAPGPKVVLSEGRNAFQDLQETWRRPPEGAWTRHGSWDSGAPLPAAQDRGLPPTWLNAGASPKDEVWVGRLKKAPEGVQEAWVRVILSVGR